jgi:hypothetical protein
MAWIRQHKSRVHRLISAVLPCLNVAVVQQCSHATFRHLKIGWFRVIKGDGLGDSLPVDQHQLMDQ